ncbi:MAG TPA: hypothetical protein VFI19_12345 [Nocardioides sp.]|nr:hypothetical protein [Nocardioides sp.]
MTTVAVAPVGRSADVQRRLEQRLERVVELVRTDRVVQVALGMIIVQLTLRAWAIYGGWFVLDDFNFIARMAHGGGDPLTAARIYNGHLMPAGMYLSWLNAVAAPWQWSLPASELLLMQLVADLAMLRLLVELHGRRPGILPPLAIYLFAVLTLEGTVWWAAGVTALPLEIATLLALTAHLRYLRSGRLRYAWEANGWIAFGMLFSERSALIYVAVAVFTLCWFARGYGWRRVASAVRGRTRALTLYAATGAGYVLLYLVVGRSFEVARSTDYPTFDVARSLVVHEYLPAVVGGPLQWAHFGIFSAADPSDAVVLGSLVVVGLVINEVLRHRRNAARALALPVVFLGLDVVLVLLTQQLGDGAALVFDYRFQGEMALMTALALAAMTMPINGATVSSSWRSESELLDHPRRVTVLVAAIVVLACVSTIGWVTGWHSDRRSQQWVQAVTHSLETSPAPVPVADRVVPGYVMAPIDGSGGLASRLFAREPNADWVTVNTDTLHGIDDSGRVLPVLVPALHRGVPGPVADCGYRLGAAPTTIPLDAAATEAGLWLRIGYLSSASSPMRVTVGDRTVATTVQPGVHALFVRAGGTFDSVRVSGLSDQTTVCTDDVTVGTPEPYDEQGASKP